MFFKKVRTETGEFEIIYPSGHPLQGQKVQKEVMPYSLYTESSVKKESIYIKNVEKYYEKIGDKKSFDQFLKNIEEWDLRVKRKQFDHIGYCIKYCEIDVYILEYGYDKFREDMRIITGLDTDNIVSSASIAHKFLQNEGVYDDVLMFSGVCREYIQQSVVGGRVMLSENKPRTVNSINGEVIQDFDGVSLYPSAMVRIAEEYGGYLKGKPNLLKSNQLDYNFLKKQDGYFVTINIKKVNKKLKFPIISELTTEGIRNFTNEPTNNIVVNKIQLEDLIEFQKIEFDIIEGYYFNEGRNPIIGEVMTFLFNERLKQKKAKNPIQAQYKLLMNSSYGRTILRALGLETRFINEKDINKYVTRNYNMISSFSQIFDSAIYKIKINKSIYEHFSMPHVGSEILAMSKRIMSEVMVLCEDEGINNSYTDTDSIHMPQAAVSYLEEQYKVKYGRELIGKGLGQFHCDFDDNISEAQLIGKADLSQKGKVSFIENEEKKQYDYMGIPFSRVFIGLGKKCYMDELIIIKDGMAYIKHHIRMKGVPTNSIKYKAKSLNISITELYQRLFNGECFKFNLLTSGVKMEYTADFQIRNRTNFMREVSFSKNKKNKHCRSM